MIKLIFFLNKLGIKPVCILYDSKRDKDLLKLYRVSGIYMWYNNVNDKYYIGSATNLWDRLRRYYLDYDLKKDRLINKALSKYGHENFSIIILSILNNASNSELLAAEQYYLDILNPHYNIAKFAGNTKDVKHTEESKLKISLANKGRIMSEAFIEGRRLATLGNTNSLGFKYSKEDTLKWSLNRRKKVYVYNSNDSFLFYLDSYYLAADHFNVNRGIITKYVKSGQLFKDEYILRSIKLLSIDIYDLNYNLVYSFNSYEEAGKYFNVGKTSILNYSKSGKCFKGKFFIKSNFFIPHTDSK